MKKYKKRQLLEMLDILDFANEAIKDGKCKDVDEIIDVLVQCQQLALNLGNKIETWGYDSQHSVTLLEEYCELVYQLSLVIKDRQHRDKLLKKIRTQLHRIRNSILYKLPKEKKEIVFLPYKASMWDSLESIWMAACNMENCRVYVVPIPYFERNSDGSFGQMHDEGGLFPDYVPITSWLEYDIRESKPDIIFIHNPYDSWNHVTSVHPDYYSDELKKYTGYLVYSPYFISSVFYENVNDYSPKNPYHLVPGAVNADLIIVHSEVVKTALVSTGYPEDKVEVLGSPKIDAIVHAEAGRVKICDEWRRKIGKRKVILYNTSITNFLNYEFQYGVEMLGVIEEIVNYLLCQNDFSLIWRPHPLLESTIKAMRGDKWDRYQRVAEKVKKSGKDIYDDTPSPFEAIVISDALVSDFSSIMKQYLATGKPILSLELSGTMNPKYKGVDLFSLYYTLDGMQIYDFCNMLRRGEDNKRCDRIRAFQDSFINYDGTSGEKIMQFVLKK